MDRKIEKRAGRKIRLLALAALVAVALYGAYLLLADLSVSRLTVDPDRLLITTVDRGPFQEQVTVEAEVLASPTSEAEGAGDPDDGDGGALTVRARLHPSYLPRIEVGAAAEMELGDGTYELAVSGIDAAGEDGRASLELRFVDTPPDGVGPGATPPVHLALGVPSAVIRLRKGAFFQQTGGQWVYVVDDEAGTAVKRRIRLGRQSAAFHEVVSGLQPGDRVIISSYEPFGDVERLLLRRRSAGSAAREAGSDPRRRLQGVTS